MRGACSYKQSWRRRYGSVSSLKDERFLDNYLIVPYLKDEELIDSHLYHDICI